MIRSEAHPEPDARVEVRRLNAKPPWETRLNARPGSGSAVVDQRVDLHAAVVVPRLGQAGRERDRLLPVGRLDDVEAAHRLFGLQERAVHDQRLLPIAGPQGRRGAGRLELARGADRRTGPLHELAVALVDLLHLGGTHRVPALLVAVDEDQVVRHVTHVLPAWGCLMVYDERRRRGWTPRLLEIRPPNASSSSKTGIRFNRMSDTSRNRPARFRRSTVDGHRGPNLSCLSRPRSRTFAVDRVIFAPYGTPRLRCTARRDFMEDRDDGNAASPLRRGRS